MSEKESGSVPPTKKKRITPVIPKTPLDAQRIQLEKLMADTKKEVVIPEMQKDEKFPEPPEFMRFYMGSSAGAGSEVFHIYRHLRRKETIRQDFIRSQADKDAKEEEFQLKLAENKAKADERTAKKRAKRLKKKQHKKETNKTVSSPPNNGKQSPCRHEPIKVENKSQDEAQSDTDDD